MYGLFTKASHRNVWCVRVLLDTEIDSAAYIPDHGREKKFLLTQKPPDQLWGSPSLLFTGTGDLSRELNGQGVKGDYPSSSSSVMPHLYFPLHVPTTGGQQHL